MIAKYVPFSYHIIAEWPDGETRSCEADCLDRDAVFDAAGELICKDGCTVRILQVTHGDDMVPASVRDVTEDFRSERGVSDPEEEPYDFTDYESAILKERRAEFVRAAE